MSFLVSIIIPSYNRSSVIEETLDSVIKQTHQHWECLIVDDGSTDNSLNSIEDYVKKDSRFQLHLRPKTKPKGANACRNYGVSLCVGNYILFLDSDDILQPFCLEKRLEIFQNNDSLDCVVADTALLIDESIGEKSINNDPKITTPQNYLLKFLSYQLPWTSTLSVLWKKELIVNNPFDESLQRLQDVDFHINILKENCRIERLYVVDNFYRVDNNKKTDKQHIASVLKNFELFFNKHIKFVLSNENYKTAFQQFNNYFLNHYILVNYNEFNKEVKSILEAIYNSELYASKQLKIIKLSAFLVKSGLYKTKYIGMYRFRKYLQRKLENS